MKKILILLAVVLFTSACPAYYSGYYGDYDSRSGWYGISYRGYHGNYHGYRNDRDHDWNRGDRNYGDRERGDKDHGDRDGGDNRDRGDRDGNWGHADRNYQTRNFGGEYRR